MTLPLVSLLLSLLKLNEVQNLIGIGLVSLNWDRTSQHQLL